MPVSTQKESEITINTVTEFDALLHQVACDLGDAMRQEKEAHQLVSNEIRKLTHFWRAGFISHSEMQSLIREAYVYAEQTCAVRRDPEFPDTRVRE